jgi:hypothetical protein
VESLLRTVIRYQRFLKTSSAEGVKTSTAEEAKTLTAEVIASTVGHELE